MRLACFASAILLLASTTAFADEPETVFVRLGPDAPGAALDVTFLRVEEDESPEARWIQRLNARVETLAQTGIGGYAELAAAHDQESSALGNLDVGALFRRATARSAITARAGLVLPTMTDEEEGASFWSTLIADPSDAARALHDNTTLRLAVTPSWRWSSTTRFRIDAGVDVPFTHEGDAEGLTALLHLDAGVAYGRGAFGAAFELQALVVVEEDGPDLLPVATGTVQYRTSAGTAFAGVSTIPLPGLSEIAPLTVNLGFRIPL
jgi:hypothetical protein